MRISPVQRGTLKGLNDLGGVRSRSIGKYVGVRGRQVGIEPELLVSESDSTVTPATSEPVSLAQQSQQSQQSRKQATSWFCGVSFERARRLREIDDVPTLILKSDPNKSGQNKSGESR